MTGDRSAPMVSVIVPSYNQGGYLRACITSILEQDYRPIEIIVVDGASSDETVEVLESFADSSEVRWTSEPDDGIADAVNKGLARAQGQIIGIQSSDDYYLPDAFKDVVRVFQESSEVGLVYGDAISIDAEGNVGRVWCAPQHRNDLCIALCVCIPQSSAFFDRELARQLGGWRDTYHTADWEFWLRMMFRTRVVKIDRNLSAWRSYPGQRTDQRLKVFVDYRRMVDESPDVRTGGWRVRQAARASKRLIGVSYNRRGPWSKLRWLAAATALYPPIWRHVPGKRAMVPPVRQVVRSLRAWAR